MSDSGDTRPSRTATLDHYEIGAHALILGRRGKWWIVSIDGAQLRGKFPTAASAWTAGVRHADRLDGSSGESAGRR